MAEQLQMQELPQPDNKKLEEILSEINNIKSQLAEQQQKQLTTSNENIVAEMKDLKTKLAEINTTLPDKKIHFTTAQLVTIITTIVATVGGIVTLIWNVSSSFNQTLTRLDNITTKIDKIEKTSEKEKNLRKAEYANRYRWYNESNSLFYYRDSLKYLRYRDSVLIYDIDKDTLLYLPYNR